MLRLVFVICCTLQQWRSVEFKEKVLDKALELLVGALKKTAFAVVICLFALVGGSVGTMMEAFKGGHGTGIGAIAGAAVALQLFRCTATQHTFYSFSNLKEAIMESLVDGEGLMNWATNFSEYMYREMSEVVAGAGAGEICVEGMSMESVQKLPVCEYDHTKMNNSISCSICLEEFEDGEFGKRLPNCDHLFHVGCIDQWLYLHGSCPFCRKFCF